MSIALKFTSLFVRTLAKPIANQIKSQAHEHPRFRKKCITVAQFLHRTEITLRRHLLNENDKKVRPLNDARAIATGANFVAETFVFSVAGALILYESWRSRRKEMKRQASVADDIQFLQGEISWIKEKLEQNTIIKHGEDVPLPSDLQLLVLKWVKERRQEQDEQAKKNEQKPKEAQVTEKVQATKEAQDTKKLPANGEPAEKEPLTRKEEQIRNDNSISSS